MFHKDAAPETASAFLVLLSAFLGVLFPYGIAGEPEAVTEDRWLLVAGLVKRARSGDEQAFRSLLEQHRREITSTLFACGVRCQDTALDLGQDVAIKAWTRLDTLKDGRTFPAWIRRIAANAARDHLRRRAVRREDSITEAIELAGDDDPHADQERMAEIRHMLAAIEDEDKEVVELLVSRANGVPVATLAKGLGVSEAALKMRLMRVRKRLRTRLEELRRGE